MSSSASHDDRQNLHPKSVSQEPVTSVIGAHEIAYDPDHPTYDQDEETLNALGYKSEFKREFNLFTTFCVSFAVLGLLPSFASTLYYGMGYAGTAGMTWGWIVAMIGIQSVAMSMAELASSMPTSGGLYYAAAVLAPEGWGPLAAWLTGWSNWLVQITSPPSVDYGIAAMILAAASITNPDYIPTGWQTFLLSLLIMLLQAIISSLPTRRIAQVNSVGSVFNMVALCAVIILIPAGTDRESRGLPKFTSSHDVWSTIYPGTDWPSGIAIIMSFTSVIWTMSGYDSPFHLAEECSNASIASPRAIVLTSLTGGLFGFFLQLVVAYTVVDISSVLDSDLGQPYAAYLVQCLPYRMTMAILALTVIAGFFMGQGCMVAASRVTFAYARDGCLPMSWWIRKVNLRTRTPVNAVWFNCSVGCLLLLLIFAGEITISALFSVGALAAFVSFSIPIALRVFCVRDNFRPGPWNLGKAGVPIAVVATGFVVMMVPILCFPASKGENLTAEDMNWTVLVYGGPMLLVCVWWIVDARKWFEGPKVNVEHRMLGENKVISGREVRESAGADNIGHAGSSGDSSGRTAKKGDVIVK